MDDAGCVSHDRLCAWYACVVMACLYSIYYGGEKGIRTPDTFDRIHDFQSCAFDHSATSPFLHYCAALLDNGQEHDVHESILLV